MLRCLFILGADSLLLVFADVSVSTGETLRINAIPDRVLHVCLKKRAVNRIQGHMASYPAGLEQETATAA